MTKEQIEAVLDRVRSWPKNRQEDAATMLLTMEAQSSVPYALSAEERADLETALEEAAHGDFATEAEVEAVFAHRA